MGKQSRNTGGPYRLRGAIILGIVCLLLPVGAYAEVSARDGYAPNGAYQVHVELIPYLWLPAVSGTVKLGNGAQVNLSQGVPSVSQLTSVLTGAFIGAGLLRYGPWSAGIDIQYVSAATTKDIGPDLLGRPRSLELSTSLTRVAPGFGYQIYNGALGTVPATVDASVGFSWYSQSAGLDLSRVGLLGNQHVSGLSDSGSFVQPWAGLRADIYPWRRWRFELGAQVQGFGIDGGVWGWGASASASWAATHWLNLILGFRALSSERFPGSSRTVRSATLTAYGPMLGFGITF